MSMEVKVKGAYSQYVRHIIRVEIRDGRTYQGQLLLFDGHTNLVLNDAVETRPGHEERRNMGLMIIRGDEVVCFSVVAPPPEPARPTAPAAQEALIF